LKQRALQNSASTKHTGDKRQKRSQQLHHAAEPTTPPLSTSHFSLHVVGIGAGYLTLMNQT